MFALWVMWGSSGKFGGPLTSHLPILSATAQTTCFPSPTESIVTNIAQLFSVTSSIPGPGYSSSPL